MTAPAERPRPSEMPPTAYRYDRKAELARRARSLRPPVTRADLLRAVSDWMLTDPAFLREVHTRHLLSLPEGYRRVYLFSKTDPAVWEPFLLAAVGGDDDDGMLHGLDAQLEPATRKRAEFHVRSRFKKPNPPAAVDGAA